MKKIFAVLSLLLLSTSVFAWTIGPMNYQGRLLDNNGIPVTGSFTFKVRIYDALTGGTLKFAEQQNNVAVNDGVYSFLVSTGATLSGTWDINLWNTPTLYMEIEANGQVLTPRSLLAAAPFAFQANLALTTNNALALGGKNSGAVLQDICKSGKGKWLELVSQCLGVGASFPGPAMVNLSTLTASTDLSNLDLTNADISGINFGAANFTGTLFNGASMNGGGVGAANMTNTVWNATVVTGTKIFSNNFAGARISNVNMMGWDMTAASLLNSSIADLIACPTLGSSYACLPQLDGKYFIVGSMDLSATSLMKDRLNIQNLDQNVFAGLAIGYAKFNGNTIDELNFTNNNLFGSSFDRVTIRDVGFVNSSLTNAYFNKSIVQNVHFDYIKASPFAFSVLSSSLKKVSFTALNAFNSTIAFSKSTLSEVKFIHAANDGNFLLTFNNSSLNNTLILANVSNLTISNSEVAGGIYLGPEVTPLGTNLNVTATNFANGNIGGNWHNAVFSGGSFVNVSFNGVDLSGATGLSTATYTNVNWYGAKCPDAFQVTTLGGTCIGHGI